MERLGSRGQEATERTAPEGKSSCFATADGLMCCTCLDTRCQLEGKQAEHDTVAMPIYTTQSPANHEALCCKQQSSPCTLASDPTWRAGTAFGCLKASTLPSLASGVMAATRPRLNTEAERRGPRSCCAASPSSPTLCRARLGEAGSSSSLQAEPPRDRPGRGHTECELQGRGRAFLGMCACVVYMCGSDRDAGLMSGAACACRCVQVREPMACDQTAAGGVAAMDTGRSAITRWDSCSVETGKSATGSSTACSSDGSIPHMAPGQQAAARHQGQAAWAHLPARACS